MKNKIIIIFAVFAGLEIVLGYPQERLMPGGCFLYSVIYKKKKKNVSYENT